MRSGVRKKANQEKGKREVDQAKMSTNTMGNMMRQYRRQHKIEKMMINTTFFF